MTREKFLTVRWNNYLTLGLGLPILIFVIGALSSDLGSESAGFIILMIFGAVY